MYFELEKVLILSKDLPLIESLTKFLAKVKYQSLDIFNRIDEKFIEFVALNEVLVIVDYAYSDEYLRIDLDYPAMVIIDSSLQINDILKYSNENVGFIIKPLDEIEFLTRLNILFKKYKNTKTIQRTATSLASLYDVSLALSSTFDLEKILKLIVEDAAKAFAADVVSLMLINEKEQVLEIKVAVGLDERIVKDVKQKLGSGIAGKVAKTGKPLLLVDTAEFKGKKSKYESSIKSAISVPLMVKEKVIGVLNVSKVSVFNFSQEDLKALFNMAILAAQAIERANLYNQIRRSYEELQTTYISTITALSKAIEAKDPYTRGHMERVTKYGLAIAMLIDPKLLNDDAFRFGLMLHDIGKIEIPDSILLKPSYLTEEEYAIIKKHPEVGENILAPVRFLQKAARIVRSHQERWDGKGYPDGLKGEQIPLEARITAVADTFDAIISDRPYRKGKSIEYAVNEIKKHSGTQFDPTVVNYFIKAVEMKLIP